MSRTLGIGGELHQDVGKRDTGTRAESVKTDVNRQETVRRFLGLHQAGDPAVKVGSQTGNRAL